MKASILIANKYLEVKYWVFLFLNIKYTKNTLKYINDEWIIIFTIASIHTGELFTNKFVLCHGPYSCKIFTSVIDLEAILINFKDIIDDK